MQAVRQEAVNKPFYRSTQCRSCSHKVVLLVFGSNLTLTFFSGSREIFLFMFCPEQAVNLKRLQDTGLYSILRYINTTHLFLKEKSEKPLEFFFFFFFVYHVEILFSQFSAHFGSQRETYWLEL